MSVHISAVSVEARRGRWIPGAVVTLQPELSLQLHLCLADTITPTTLRNLPVTPPSPVIAGNTILSVTGVRVGLQEICSFLLKRHTESNASSSSAHSDL